MEQRTVTIKNFFRITKIVQVSAMKVHFQIAERSLFYLNPDIQHRWMTYPPERGFLKSEMELKGSCNYHKTAEELIKNNRKLKTTFDNQLKFYEKLYK